MYKQRRHLLDLSTAAIASFLATGVDWLLYLHLLEFMTWGDIYHVGFAAVVAALLGGLSHFILCRYWVFQRFDKSLLSSLATYAVMSVAAASAHGLTTHMLAMHATPSTAWLASKVLLFLCWTYPLSRFVVFGQVSEGMN